MSQTKLVAIIDDEASIREALTLALSREGYALKAFPDGSAALCDLSVNPPDAIILDIAMPRMDGIEFCTRYRALQPSTPIIFLSSRSDEDQRLEALEKGGDDFLVKPYSLAELLTRLRVCFMRIERFACRDGKTRSSSNGDELKKVGKLRIDPARWEAMYDGKSLELTVTEFRILCALASSPGRVYDRETLIASSYPDDSFVSDRNIDAHIKRLRKKIKAHDPSFSYIETVHGIGYRYAKDAP